MNPNIPFLAPPNLPNPMRDLRDMHKEAMQSQIMIADQLQQLIDLQKEQNQLFSQILAKSSGTP